jgi:CYTH domain-containing protein
LITLKKYASKSLIRKSYQFSIKPNITIKIYLGELEGFARAEVEFSSESDARNFKPLAWMGKEITTSPIGSDSKLINVDKKTLIHYFK